MKKINEGKKRTMIPSWLHDLSIAYLVFGAVCAIIIAVDEIRHPQHMGIMNVVCPVTALFGTAWILWQYFTYGRLATHEKMHTAMERDEKSPNKRLTPFPVMVGNGALHCGSRCTLGDICAAAMPGSARYSAITRLGNREHILSHPRFRHQAFNRRSAARSRSTIRRELGSAIAALFSRVVNVRETVSMVSPR